MIDHVLIFREWRLQGQLQPAGWLDDLFLIREGTSKFDGDGLKCGLRLFTDESRGKGCQLAFSRDRFPGTGVTQLIGRVQLSVTAEPDGLDTIGRDGLFTPIVNGKLDLQRVIRTLDLSQIQRLSSHSLGSSRFGRVLNDPDGCDLVSQVAGFYDGLWMTDLG